MKVLMIMLFNRKMKKKIMLFKIMILEEKEIVFHILLKFKVVLINIKFIIITIKKNNKIIYLLLLLIIKIAKVLQIKHKFKLILII